MVEHVVRHVVDVLGQNVSPTSEQRHGLAGSDEAEGGPRARPIFDEPVQLREPGVVRIPGREDEADGVVRYRRVDEDLGGDLLHAEHVLRIEDLLGLVRADPGEAQGYVPMYYTNTFFFEDASPVTLTGSSDATNIDFELVSGRLIRGTITDTNALPIPDIDLDLFDTNGVYMEANAATDVNGNYAMGPLQPGAYVVRADPTEVQGYLRVYYHNAFFSEDASPVTVDAASDAVGIDFEHADIRHSDLRNADLTKSNLNKAKLWGCKVRNTKLPSAVGHLKLLLMFSQVFQIFSKRADKARDMRERKRIRQVAELVREREAERKRRAR